METVWRIWKIVQLLSEDNFGWVDAAETRKKLTEPDSANYVCSDRHLRRLLQEGEGVFWTQGNDRIWLWARKHVTKGLGVKVASGRPVKMPLEIMTAPIGKLRAHIYASFHSGRKRSTPISRAALTEGTSASRRSQQRYEKIAGVKTQRNIAVGERYSDEAFQHACWRHGNAVFVLTDYRGIHGKPGIKYIAWQLPSSYSRIHKLGRSGGRRRLNRQLVDLRNSGDAGNGRLPSKLRRYHEDGKRVVEVGGYMKGPRSCWYYFDMEKSPITL